MREIKFKGLRKDGEGWVYGYYFEGFTGIPYILVLHDHILRITEYYEVIPETVGQYTGLKDKNGKEIYEGDILRDWVDTDEGMIQSKQQVFWKNGGWKFDFSKKQDKSIFIDLYNNLKSYYESEVIGNIYEQPNNIR